MKSKQSNNPPEVVIELDRADAEFIIENCESNMGLAPRSLQLLSDNREACEKIVELNEKFKRVRAATIKALAL